MTPQVPTHSSRTAPTALAVAVSLASLAPILSAAPSLDIRTIPGGGPVAPFGGPAGPGFDPLATAGQWFAPASIAFGSDPFPLSHEFHDNVFGPDGGGGAASFGAIRGVITEVTFAGGPGAIGTPITGFTITATVTNDTPAQSPWVRGDNDHDEARPFASVADQYVGPLVDPVITAEFAWARPPGFRPTSGPYTGPGALPYAPFSFVAVNHQLLAWYSFSPGADGIDPAHIGDFQVPAWFLPTIPVGGSASTDMTFDVFSGDEPGSIPSDDPFYPTLLGWYDTGYDLLLNRTTDLKIGDWMDVLTPDEGIPYQVPPARSGNASVFHNVIPEPSTWAAIIGAAALAVVGLRRRR